MAGAAFSRDQVRAALRAGRPGAVLDGYRDRALWERAGRRAPTAGMLRAIDERAAEWRRTPIPPLPFSGYRRFADDGARTPFEREYFARRRRLTDLALAAVARPDGSTAALADTVWAICDEYSWALPAHLAELLAPAPAVPHDRQIDLFAAETGFALAEISALLPERLAPLVAERAAAETRRRVLDPYLRLPPFAWESGHTNWTSVCAAGVGTAALHLLDPVAEADELLEITVRVLAAMGRFLDGFGADGVCLEGLDYWAYGFGFFVAYAEALRRYTGGALDPLADPSGLVERIALFPQRVFLGGSAVAAFSDASPHGSRDPGLAAFLRHRFPAVTPPDEATRTADPVDHCGRWGPALRSLVWATRHAGGAAEAAPAGPDPGGYLPDAQWLVSRQRAAGGEVALAAKGGHNEEPHNHNDLGSFVLVRDGEPLLAELGAGHYTRDYFGPKRYDILCNGSQGHSLPLVNGVGQESSARAVAEVLLAEHAPALARLRLEIGAAYPVPGLASLVRNLTFADGVLTVRDAFAGAGPLAVVERFVSFHRPTLTAPGRAELRGERAALALRYDPERWRATVVAHPHERHDGTPVTVYSLDLAGDGADGAFELVVTALAE
ncbi:heparinase II/III family protein [Streptomyces sp. DSM 44915]|uniref:Heparinase II/III family protein n=1 Tax=Streptomyces chisholmiae TaxID=3075540 RepID=A0ABU2JUV1_9ACTN|nr:heparinase II/III family protein [Streptomyces sp. DSM 44915]MDT0268536.1 heparinase II/III family protein [Streptomyces sp. DSM 44915]